MKVSVGVEGGYGLVLEGVEGEIGVGVQFGAIGLFVRGFRGVVEVFE
jgi:hypothetical protein